MEKDRYGVMGNPISHSKSPYIHQHFAKQTHQKIHYEAILVAENSLAEAIKLFFSSGGKGLNITVPFKQQAKELVDECSDAAHVAGAVNTILLCEDGRLRGDNTDGIGLVRDIEQNLGFNLLEKHILVLGAGGAVRGVLPSLLAKKPAQLIITNRTISTAKVLVKEYSDHDNIHSCEYEGLDKYQFDWIINGTAASLQGEVPPVPLACFNSATKCYDMMFADKLTVFQEWAAAHGIKKHFDGKGMLVEQAAESFFLWRGVRPKTNKILRLLENNLI